jgi:HJR/Mrr/RecB family endonuclease
VAEKVAAVGVGRERDWMYYIKDGQVWKVQRKSPGVPKGRPQMVVDAGIEMDTNYIYFLDRDGDVARARRAAEGDDDDDGDEETGDSNVPTAAPNEARELLYTLFPDLNVPKDTGNIKLVQHEAARIFADINRLDQLRRLSPREFEQLLAEVFHREGYEAHLTPPSKDGGRDVIAVLPGPLPFLVVAEAKHMRLVKPSVVLAMYGVKSRDNAHMGLVATTGRFSKGTREMTQRTWGRQIGLQDGEEFVSRILDIKRGRAG